MKRLIDLSFSLILLIIFFPIIILISFMIIIIYQSNPLHLSKRIGVNSKIFLMPKFITMKKNTPQIATHLLKNSDKYVTKLGKFLRKTSLDELPQLCLVLSGHMSLVGPRPALYNQHYLIKKRKKYQIDKIKPGITGYAQVNGRDNISLKNKIKLDNYYSKNMSLKLDFKIMLITIIKIFTIKNISH